MSSGISQVETLTERNPARCKADPFDNAKAENFMKTLKTEEINGKAFADISDARRRVNGFIDEVYNKDRLHSALGYQSPFEFEAVFAQNRTA
jgi:putative transposase